MSTLLFISHTAPAAVLLDYWDFNNVTSNYSSPSLGVFATNSTNGSVNNGEIYNSGTRLLSSNGGGFSGGPVFTNGSINLNGVKGSPNFGNTTTTSWGAFSDSGFKAPNDPTSGASLIMINAEKTSANNPSIIFNLSSAGYSDLTFSMYARKAGGVTQALSLTWYSSLDGGSTWSLLTTPSLPSGSTGAGSFVSYSFGLGSSLNNQSSFQLRLDADLSGANTGTSFAIDNVQLNAATAIPEPATLCLIGLGGLMIAFGHNRKAKLS